jgi:hypothetical protein
LSAICSANLLSPNMMETPDYHGESKELWALRSYRVTCALKHIFRLAPNGTSR